MARGGVTNHLNESFDGDYMSGQLGVDNVEARAMARMAPHTGLPDLRKPLGIGRAASIPAQTLSTINRRLEEGDDVCVAWGG